MSDSSAMTWGGEPNSEERMWALGAHLLAFVFPVLGAVGVYLIKKDESRYVGYHAIQAIAWQAAIYIIGTITCGFGLIGLLGSIYMALKANSGEWTGYPLLSGVGRDD